MGEALARFIDAMSSEPVHLVGNSMGGALSLLEGHARPHRIASALLVNPAVPAPLGMHVDPWWLKTFAMASVPMGHRLLQRRAARLGRERLIRELIDVCCVDATKIPANVMDALVAEAIECGALPWIDLAFSEATRSLLGELFFGRRIRKAVREPGVPTLIVHGRGKRLKGRGDRRARHARTHPPWSAHTGTIALRKSCCAEMKSHGTTIALAARP